MEEKYADSVLLAQTIVRDNPSVEDARFFFEYRLVLPDNELVSQWLQTYTRARENWMLSGEQSCALQRRRVDTFSSGQQLGEWVAMQFAKTVWQLLWECRELRRSDIESCHPLFAFARGAYTRVDEIDQALSRLTERGLREDFEARFRRRTSRLRNQERIVLIRNVLLQDFKKENMARLGQCNTLQTERERFIQGVDAPQLLLGDRTIPVAGSKEHDPFTLNF